MKRNKKMFKGSNVEKTFLFDVASKIYIATDSSPVDMATYELCCDMIDVTIDISSIYGLLFATYLNCKQKKLVKFFINVTFFG